MERDRIWKLGHVFYWGGGRSYSFHAGPWRLLWIRDTRVWKPIFSDRHPSNRRHLLLGPWRLRFMEHV